MKLPNLVIFTIITVSIVVLTNETTGLTESRYYIFNYRIFKKK